MGGAGTALLILVAVLGACVGSFLNVVVYRMPRRESVVQPPSHCRHCGYRLPWHDKVPLLSWLLLKGRCRRCGGVISVRYLLLEALTAGLWVAVLQTTGHNRPVLLLSGWTLMSWLLVLALLDLDTMWLPEPLCRWGVVTGLLLTVVVALAAAADPVASVLHHGLAVILGLLGFELVSVVGEWLLGVPALGLGDAKLAAMLGAWLGGAGLAAAVIMAVAAASLFGLYGRLSGRLGPRQPFAFGPFLALAGGMAWLGAPTLQTRVLAAFLPWLVP